MKNKLIFFIITAILSACAHEPAPKPVAQNTVRTLICPAQDLLSSGITQAKPISAEDLVRQSITPPAVSPTKEWSINGLAVGNQNLFLSCYYSSRKILTFKLPLQNEFCMAKDTDRKTFVECVKK